MIKKLTVNARNPKGVWGALMIKKMNKGHARMTKWALSQLAPEKEGVLLDIGCGGGNAVALLAQAAPFSKVYGIDYSQLSVEKASARNKNAIREGRVKILCSGVSSMPFQDRSVDLATAVETIYFWPDLKHDFKEVFRVLKDGGRFCVVCEMVKNSDGTGAHTEVADFLKLHYLTREEIERLFIAAGFKNITVRTKDDSGWLMAAGTK